MDDLISRQEAIDAVKEERFPIDSDYAEGFMAALDKVEWILKEWLPSAQPETHEERTETHACDLISRQAVLDGKIVAVISDQIIEVVPVSHINNIPLSPSKPQEIYCKDCKWRNDVGHWLGCPILNSDDDNFCSMAERRTDGN